MFDFGERLRSLRLARKLTQKQVANAIGIAERNYQRLEAGKPPAYYTLLALADYFDLSLDYLTGRSDNPEISQQKKESKAHENHQNH